MTTGELCALFRFRWFALSGVLFAEALLIPGPAGWLWLGASLVCQIAAIAGEIDAPCD